MVSDDTRDKASPKLPTTLVLKLGIIGQFRNRTQTFRLDLTVCQLRERGQNMSCCNEVTKSVTLQKLEVL